MSNDAKHSVVELKIGRNEVRLEGTEEFISQELSTILEQIDIVSQQQARQRDRLGSAQSSPSDEDTEVGANKKGKGARNLPGILEGVANKINVKVDKLEDHFYVEDDDIHIADPLEIEPKYAVIGYCIIKEYVDNEIYHNNTETKKKIIDAEKVNIDKWGDLLFSLRRSGHIKDDPNYPGDRNKPFKVTPKGQKELVEWLNENN